MPYSLKISAFATFAVVLAGCSTNPIIPARDIYQPYPQVHLTSDALYRDVVVGEAVPSRVGAGQLRVDVPVRNKTDDAMPVDYQYRFLNSNSGQVEPTSGWMTLRLPPRSEAVISITSMTAEARDFDVNIRRAR